ncbi:MAG: hypothetical protein EP330_16820 [Deltaproteobacteria bacterium]|nr:MAG: hypothetical protein EP330_16820 [Deltaproteobacteria bacterium]
MANAQGKQLELPNQLPSPNTMDPEERLFRHEKKPDWGVGLWVHEEKKRRRLRFEDGEMRAFRKGFYHLLIPVDSTRVDVDAVFERIVADHEILAAEARDTKPAKPPVMSFEEQLLVFNELYPQGFQDPDYLDAYRSPAEGRTSRKSHVDAAIARAKENLAQPVLSRALEEGRGTDVHQAVIALLDGTSLVKPARLKLFANLPESDHFVFAESLYQLLHSEARYRERFEQWLRNTRKLSGADVSWPLATVLPALLRPERHVVIKARVFSLQARALAPDQRVKKIPSRRGYRKGRRIALATQKALENAGLEPRDLFDVSNFIWETLRPKGRKVLETLKGSA